MHILNCRFHLRFDVYVQEVFPRGTALQEFKMMIHVKKHIEKHYKTLRNNLCTQKYYVTRKFFLYLSVNFLAKANKLDELIRVSGCSRNLKNIIKKKIRPDPRSNQHEFVLTSRNYKKKLFAESCFRNKLVNFTKTVAKAGRIVFYATCFVFQSLFFSFFLMLNSH